MISPEILKKDYGSYRLFFQFIKITLKLTINKSVTSSKVEYILIEKNEIKLRNLNEKQLILIEKRIQQNLPDHVVISYDNFDSWLWRFLS